MQARPFHLAKLAIATLIASPAFVFAVPATSPYYTDTVNSYVQDQVSKDMEELNGFLCLINAMAPSQMVNEPDYIAMVDLKACRPNTSQNNNNMGGGNNGNNMSSSYLSVQLNSARLSNTAPMLTKIWLDDFVYSTTTGTGAGATTTNTNISVPMYISATQAPGKSAPYGVFRLDYCKQFPTDTTCTKRIGYIDATRSGLAFYTLDYKTGQYGEYYDEFALQLGANSSTNSGSGIVIKTNTNNASGAVNTSAIVFAHSPDYFYRDDGVNPAQCFNRADKYAEESVWRYGLYDATTGERLNHQSGFPIEYTDSSNVTSSGYIGYWGLWMPVAVPSGATLSQISYDTYPPSKKNYTLLQAGGKLTKYSTNFKKLSDLHKLPIWYYPYADVGTAMLQYNSYMIYWDNTAQQFFVAQQYVTNPTTGSYDLVKLSPPVPVDNALLVAADAYTMGLSGWSEAIGGSFSIKYSDFSTLNLAQDHSNIRVITQTQDVIYPKDYAAINAAGGLQCITDCPTVASISAYNTAIAGGNYNTPQFAFPSYDATYAPILYSTLANTSYSLDPASGNMLEGAPVGGAPSAGSPVIQTTTYGIYSGRLITGNDMAYIAAVKPCPPGPACYSSSDVDLLADNPNITSYSYYTWETSNNSWNQMGFLIDNTTTPATTVKFYPPLPVSFTVPNTTKYGTAAGTTISLQYNDFGNLWGIPNKCVDMRTNGDCVYSAVITAPVAPCTSPTYDTACSTTITPWDKQYWTAQYSIPFGAEGIVTAEISQGDITDAGYVAKGSQFLVKALEKELRLSKVPVGICTVLGLDQPISVTKLPSADQWNDPTPNIGAKPVLSPVPAPRVIHGVKQY